LKFHRLHPLLLSVDQTPRRRDMPDFRTGVSRDHHPDTPRAVYMALPRGAEEPRLGPPTDQDLMRFATICRVTKIIRPYLEALL
jgi:hypothetical protein